MKKIDQINFQNRTAFYASLYPKARKIAADHGYALAIHGSLDSDMDLVAVPWTDDCSLPSKLVDAIAEAFDLKATEANSMPGGRVCYTIPICWDYYIDLNVVIPSPAP